MSYADTLLANGERITLRSRQHWLAIVVDARWGFAALIGALVLLLIGAGPLGKGDNGGLVDAFKGILGIVTLVIFVLGLAIVGLTVANWFNEEYLVTNRRVMKVSGVDQQAFRGQLAREDQRCDPRSELPGADLQLRRPGHRHRGRGNGGSLPDAQGRDHVQEGDPEPETRPRIRADATARQPTAARTGPAAGHAPRRRPLPLR